MPQTARGVGGWWLAGGGHLYFLILIAQLYGVFLFWPRSVRGTAVAAAVALALQTALCVYRLYAPATAPLNGVFLSFGYELFFFWIGYFALGAALGARLSKGTVGWASWPFWLAVPIGAALLFFLDHSGAANASFAQGTGAFLRPVLPPVALATFVALALSADSALANWPFARRVVSVVSRYSLGVYILHEALMYVPGRLLSQPLLHRHLPVSVVGFVLLVLATLVIALAATRLLVATPMAITLGSARMPLRIRR
jgi:surface polysaccharide O-acyltransferase-like enzyme